MIENWKDIPEFEGFYQISDLGRVKSMSRVIIRKNGRKQTWPEKILNQTKMKDGYLSVGLYKVGYNITAKVHQLVAIAFHGHKPCGFQLVVGHKNHNKTDNRSCNLEIITNRENTNQSHLHSSSKHVGVCYDKSTDKWVSRIRHEGKRENLGHFKCETKAALAYQIALLRVQRTQRQMTQQ